MNHPLSTLSNDQLVAELIQFAPRGDVEALRGEFVGAIYRYRAALQEVEPAQSGASLLDVGGRLYMADIYANHLNYHKVSITTKFKTSFTDRTILDTIPNHERISLQYFDAESDQFPYPDDTFDVIVCTEVLEHLAVDPMHMLAEMNRVSRNGGLLVMTTPNAASYRALSAVLAGQHPYSWAPYNGSSTDRHNREYTITELERVVGAAGFDLVRSATISPKPLSMKQRLLAAWFSLPDVIRGKSGLKLERMGENSLIVARKAGTVRDRYPNWLYYDSKRGH